MRFAINKAWLERHFSGNLLRKRHHRSPCLKSIKKVHQQSESNDCLIFLQVIILLKVILYRVVKGVSLPVVRLLLVCFLIQPTFKTLAQEYRFAHIDELEGLSNNYIKAVLRDSTGFLWIGTQLGLNRFDGCSMRVFHNEPSDSTSLFYDDVERLFQIPGGKIAVRTLLGLCIYDPVTEKFSQDFQIFKKFSIDRPADIKNIVHDSHGNYWFLMQSGGLVCYNEKTKKSILASHIDNDAGSISSNNVTGFVEHPDGSYWIVHSNGIIENITLTSQSIKVIKKLTLLNERMPDNEANFQWELLVDRDGDFWIYAGNYEKGAYYVNSSQHKLYLLGKNSPQAHLSSDVIVGVVEDNTGHIWLATGHHGIDVVDKKTFSVSNISHSLENRHTLSENSVSTMVKDKDGVIWIGTYRQGLNYFHENIMRFPLIDRYSKPYGLPYEDINSFVEDKKGNLWLGTNGGGLIYFNRQTGKFTTYRHDPKDPTSLSNDVVVSMVIDHNDKLWIGTFLGGLNLFDGQKFVRYNFDQLNDKRLPGKSAWEVFEDSQHRLWIGTLDAGVNLFDRQKKTFTRYQHPDQRALISSVVPTVTEDSEGNIWFGTSLGIDILMKSTGKIVHFEAEKNNPSALSNNVVLGVLEDSKGRMWIGTHGGLSLWQKKGNTFINFTEKHGLPHNMIMSMLEDDEGRLWLGTQNGLSCATITSKGDSVQVTFRNYSEADGLHGKRFNEDSAIKTRKGELVFGGDNGFNIFRPADIVQNKIVPQLAFTDFQLFNRTVYPGQSVNGEFTLPSSITSNPSIVLNASDNVFSIEFAALNFIQPSKNQYQYKLEGFNADWLTTNSKNRRVTFTNLSAGDYVFRVIGSNNDGVWNKKGISMHIKVLPPFWKSKRAYAVYLVIVFVLLLVIRRVVQQREKLKFEVTLQQEEAKRSRDLDMMKTRFFTNVSHELRTPLSLILSPLEQLSEQAVNTEQRKHFDLIKRNAKRLLNLVNQLLDFRKLEVHDIRFRPSEGDIVRFVKETVYSFSDISEKKDIRLIFESNVSSFETTFDHDKVEKILFNLLSNAFKFTMANGEISVILDVQDTEPNSILTLRVVDTGIGIPPEKHDLIFERFFQNDLPNSVMNQGSGIGLAITKEFVRIHGGTIRVESEMEKGSSFIIVLPLKRIVQAVQGTISEPITSEVDDSKEEIQSRLSNKPSVLLVEDSEDFRFYLKDNLKVLYNIIEAATGEEGWTKALSEVPDLVVTDITMPGMNGLELCKKIKSDQRTSHIPVILLTARSGEEQRLEGFEMGADEYIPKPFNFQVLQSRIRNLLSQRRNLQSLFTRRNAIKASEIQVISLDDQFVQRVVQIIEQNVSNADLSVIDLYRELGVSRAQFFKRIQALTGKSPLDLIRDIRLQHAIQLLEKSQLSVSEIAYKVGFKNPKYFTRYFKEVYHIPPSAYASRKRKT
jgi:signal transduction histidine kinase/ligand-binding sensor domain-containing protein/DNA-binding response OmpR family regulator